MAPARKSRSQIVPGLVIELLSFPPNGIEDEDEDENEDDLAPASPRWGSITAPISVFSRGSHVPFSELGCDVGGEVRDR